MGCFLWALKGEGEEEGEEEGRGGGGDAEKDPGIICIYFHPSIDLSGQVRHYCVGGLIR